MLYAVALKIKFSSWEGQYPLQTQYGEDAPTRIKLFVACA